MPEMDFRTAPRGGNTCKSHMPTGWAKAHREVDRMEPGEVGPARVACARTVAFAVEAVIVGAQLQQSRPATDSKYRFVCRGAAAMIAARPASP